MQKAYFFPKSVFTRHKENTGQALINELQRENEHLRNQLAGHKAAKTRKLRGKF